MVELRILEGTQAGGRRSIRHFPARLGRNPHCDLVLDDPGVWDEHVEIAYDSASGFYMTPLSEGAVIVNQHPVESAVLKNGDTLTLGGAVVQFWIAPAGQRQFRIMEWSLWIGLIALSAGQVALIRWLD
ncbi:MAG: FHA domain-containing protein [Verrucomicrobia bacterium]|jgi:pSer/pThr/pTyr-binding forkhead associated (FHA) protein|nr:FHA domain-containing protein [Verrucomicrobiota bacterium]